MLCHEVGRPRPLRRRRRRAGQQGGSDRLAPPRPGRERRSRREARRGHPGRPRLRPGAGLGASPCRLRRVAAGGTPPEHEALSDRLRRRRLHRHPRFGRDAPPRARSDLRHRPHSRRVAGRTFAADPLRTGPSRPRCPARSRYAAEPGPPRPRLGHGGRGANRVAADRRRAPRRCVGRRRRDVGVVVAVMGRSYAPARRARRHGGADGGPGTRRGFTPAVCALGRHSLLRGVRGRARARPGTELTRSPRSPARRRWTLLRHREPGRDDLAPGTPGCGGDRRAALAPSARDCSHS